MIEFWREDDARKAEDAMYCAQIDGHNIAIQSYQPRRTSGSMSDFTLGTPTFVASGYPYPVNQVFAFIEPSPPRVSPFTSSIRPHERVSTVRGQASFMALVNKFNLHPCLVLAQTATVG